MTEIFTNDSEMQRTPCCFPNEWFANTLVVTKWHWSFVRNTKKSYTCLELSDPFCDDLQYATRYMYTSSKKARDAARLHLWCEHRDSANLRGSPVFKPHWHCYLRQTDISCHRNTWDTLTVIVTCKFLFRLSHHHNIETLTSESGRYTVRISLNTVVSITGGEVFAAGSCTKRWNW